MKNIFVVPTTDATRLMRMFDHDRDELELSLQCCGWQYGVHVYVTSDEGTKDEDYCIHTNQTSIIKINKGEAKHLSGHLYLKKIILTTDSTLIADGVQAIDDEFLGWFVRNYTCEEVEVDESKYFDGSHGEYIIIIPQEESFDAQLEKLEETLEEAAENYAKQFDYAEDSSPQIDFIAGAKWQAERMYSEKEVIEILTARCKHFGTNVEPFNKLLLKQDLEWFEQFKKK